MGKVKITYRDKIVEIYADEFQKVIDTAFQHILDEDCRMDEETHYRSLDVCVDVGAIFRESPTENSTVRHLSQYRHRQT
jgi:hypothetical protein